MKIFITLLFILNLSAVQADESMLFSTIPSYVTTNQAISSLRAAALNREWSIDGEGDNELRIKLDHHGYKARLKFNFTVSDIRYFDSTTYYNEDMWGDEFGDEKGFWEKSQAPASWIVNLKKDMNIYLVNKAPVIDSLSNEQIENKLESLKKMYDNKLITEEEYKLKKKEIMSRF